MYVTHKKRTIMINYDNLNEQQRIYFTKAVDALSEFRSYADAIMYFCGNPLNDEDQKKFREAYDHVCSALDTIN